MGKTAALCIVSLFLMSCIAIDSRLTVKDNGSGTLVLTYRVSQLVVDLGISSAEKGAIPLPISRPDFERSLESAKGKVRLTRFDRSENEKDVTVHAELSFDSLDALAQVDAFRQAEMKVASNGSHHTLTQVIAHPATQQISDETLRMIDALFDGYDLTFTVEAPRPIQAAPLGTLSADKRAVSYTASIKDIVTTKNDIVMSVDW